MARFGIKEVAEVIFYELLDTGKIGKPSLFFDSLKVSNLENTADQVFAEGGRGGSQIIGWDYKRKSVFKMTDSLLSDQSLSMLAGNDIVTGTQEIHDRSVETAVTSATTGKTEADLGVTPLPGSYTVYKTNDGKIHGTEVTGVTISGTKIVMDNVSVPVGTQVIVYYSWTSAATATMVNISSDKFPKYYYVVAKGLVRDEITGKDNSIQLTMPKVKLQSGFNLTMDAANVSTFDFNLDVFKDATNSMVQIVRF